MDLKDIATVCYYCQCVCLQPPVLVRLTITSLTPPVFWRVSVTECRQLTGVFNSCLMKPLLARLGSKRKREVLSTIVPIMVQLTKRDQHLL